MCLKIGFFSKAGNSLWKKQYSIIVTQTEKLLLTSKLNKSNWQQILQFIYLNEVLCLRSDASSTEYLTERDHCAGAALISFIFPCSKQELCLFLKLGRNREMGLSCPSSETLPKLQKATAGARSQLQQSQFRKTLPAQNEFDVFLENWEAHGLPRAFASIPRSQKCSTCSEKRFGCQLKPPTPFYPALPFYQSAPLRRTQNQEGGMVLLLWLWPRNYTHGVTSRASSMCCVVQVHLHLYANNWCKSADHVRHATELSRPLF